MTSWSNALVATWLRELRAYFLTPLAYVFIAIFLVAVGAFTFEVGGFLDQGRADLGPFFVFHPWLYLLLAPAVGSNATQPRSSMKSSTHAWPACSSRARPSANW